ncbi:signal peptidase I, partial [Candidatus Gracilibacteria bacterium]|nr:signal peptidase I [Candidatus Gracilibacteria bacterium]
MNENQEKSLLVEDIKESYNFNEDNKQPNNSFEEKDDNELDIGIISKYDSEQKIALVVDIKNKIKLGDILKLKNPKDQFEFKVDKILDKNLKNEKEIATKKDGSVWINMPKYPGEIAYLTRKKGKLEELIEFLRDLIIIIIVVIIIRTYFVSPFQISGSSMEKNYHDKEFILVNKFSYAEIGNFKIGDPVRGDVVIFRPHASNGKEYYIKRVVGIPNDTIKFQDGDVYIKRSEDFNFIKLEENYLDPINKGKTFLSPDIKEDTFTVSNGEYFLMGDNRNNSSDSRSCFLLCSMPGSSHFIKRNDIIGTVLLDFGYFNIFEIKNGEIKLGQLKWIHPARLLDTPKTW